MLLLILVLKVLDAKSRTGIFLRVNLSCCFSKTGQPQKLTIFSRQKISSFGSFPFTLLTWLPQRKKFTFENVLYHCPLAYDPCENDTRKRIYFCHPLVQYIRAKALLDSIGGISMFSPIKSFLEFHILAQFC